MPENSLVNTPANTTYFTKFTGKGFRIVDSTTNLEEIMNADFEPAEPEQIENNFGSGTSYFFESTQFKLNPCKTVLTKSSIKNNSKSAVARYDRKNFIPNSAFKKKGSYHNDGMPSFSRFYGELKQLKKIDPNMRSKLSFTYFC